MARRALALADVLRDELQWVRSGDRGSGESWTAAEWDFRPADIYEPITFLAKIERSARCRGTNTLPDRYELLASLLKSDDYHLTTGTEAAERLAEALTQLVEDPELCQKLLRYPDFQRKVNGSPRIRNLILTSPTLRAQYLADDLRRDELLDDRDRLADAFDDGDAIKELLGYSAVRDAVREKRELLGAIIDSPALREALLDSSKKRTQLRKVSCGVPCDPAKVLQQLVDAGEPGHPVQSTLPAGAEFRANALLLETAFDAHLHDHRDESAMLERFNAEGLVALCFSGGGIRSATFNLGVLQGLARRNLLPKIDYLSTVSGGGYIGSWLSSWIRRHVDGMDGVNRDMAAVSVDPLDPEPGPVGHLREYSNYLAPRPTLFGPDLWSIFATYARNLLLNWTMLLPPVIVLLIVPRLYETWILYGEEHLAHLWIGWIALILAMAALAVIRPAGEYVPGKMDTIRDIRRRRKKIFWFVGLVAISALFLTTAWAIRGRVSDIPPIDVFRRSLTLFGVANLLASAIYLGRYYQQLKHSDHEELNALDRHRSFGWIAKSFVNRVGVPKIALEIFAAAAAALAGAGLVYLGARLMPPAEIHKALGVRLIEAPEIYTISAMPLFLLVLFVESTLLVGIVTLVSGELEREWWARAAAITLLAGVFWLLLGVLAIVGPALLTKAPAIISAVGGVSGLVALVRGHGDKTKAKEKQAEWKARLLSAAAVLALVVIISGLSLGVSKVLTGLAPKPAPKTTERAAEAELWVVPPGYTLTPVKPSPSKTAKLLEPNVSTKRHLATLRSGEWVMLVLVFVAILAVAAIGALLFDVNTYSMHGMYRNRLIRAYLGASRWFRRPDPFTGFDPQDDLLMAQLRPEFLWSTSFHDLDGFLMEIQKNGRIVHDKLPKRVRKRIAEFLELSDRGERDKMRNEITTVVFGSLNQMMRGTDLATGRAAPATIETLRRNRQYLEDQYPAFVRKRSRSTPLHVINIALNLVRGDNLAWQDRKAESFTVSPLHTGAAVERLGYRDSAEYGGPRGISLGTAMAVSGAAVSSNMGYNSSSTVTALLTLFNARLGWWLGNPSKSSYRFAGPRFALGPLVSEATGNTNDESKYVFLSDGGHFENLGLYEMVRRRCRLIIVSDAAADPEYEFGELANAVRKIRIDLGIPIEFTTFSIGSTEQQSGYCAIGEIRYKAAASPGHFLKNGWLIYIKPRVYPDCPIDVVNYSREGKPFPQESTVDQFFSETQFESYRELGAHIISQLTQGDLKQFPKVLQRLIRRHIR